MCVGGGLHFLLSKLREIDMPNSSTHLSIHTNYPSQHTHTFHTAPSEPTTPPHANAEVYNGTYGKCYFENTVVPWAKKKRKKRKSTHTHRKTHTHARAR